MTRSISPFEQYGRQALASVEQPEAEHVFRAGDTITGLAHRYYDNWTAWRVIADRNAIVDPRSIAVGTRLLIPPRPLETGAYESL